MTVFRLLLSNARRRARDFARASAATAAIEFAIVAPLLIALCLATLQAAVMFLIEAYFETAAEAAARVVLTNQTSSLTVAQFHTEVCNQLTAIFDCAKVVLELEPLPAGTTNLAAMLPQFDSTGTLIHPPSVDVGANAASPGEDMLLVVMYPWPVFGGPLGLNFANLGNGRMLMTSVQLFRVEPI